MKPKVTQVQQSDFPQCTLKCCSFKYVSDIHS